MGSSPISSSKDCKGLFVGPADLAVSVTVARQGLDRKRTNDNG